MIFQVSLKRYNIAAQNDLNLLHNWVSLWGLKINFDKCKVMHFGCCNNRFDYYIANLLIFKSICERSQLYL